MKKNHWIAASALACMLAFAPSTVNASNEADNKRPPVEERNFTSKAVEKLIKEVSKAIAELKKEGKVMSPKRCYYAPAE